jgi:hypothetical protein
MNLLTKRLHLAFNLITVGFTLRSDGGMRLPQFIKFSNFRIIQVPPIFGPLLLRLHSTGQTTKFGHLKL